MKPLPPLPYTSKDIAWNFMKQTPPKSRLMKAGQTVQAKVAVRKLEQAIKEKRGTPYFAKGHAKQKEMLAAKALLEKLGL